MTTLISLCIRVILLCILHDHDIKVHKETHQSEGVVNKKLNDKERVAAVLEITIDWKLSINACQLQISIAWKIKTN
ncbi:hypothetical protein BCV72DRAFT_316436 [Rhizopus microsporus var. microsporus]|uniref:Secreted protein n=2 Tax=Rhizopus microsporus TaxID=58291 RepID=A0A2G4SLQ8_RHIZD|nr:uncharacterized protein RHIMIDRAFT_299720 [Rhizopus microsporus ATCC 52813]ORE03007.1 hypothetical protein BCV72DRAFT_316436 [Rhizopus microsporus var. microsporus]PHZ09701.1 hypothetical protein RHIMIDRAFT_299720 [Rhizopus microsporus ATCC 52813]